MLMTLLSIIQAISLELAWERLRESDFLWAGGVAAAIGWLQGASIFLGIILVWVFYMNAVMRFTWLPAVRDSITPFLIGLLEFSMIELMGPGHVGPWLLCMGTVFAFSTFTANDIYGRARRDPENADYFAAENAEHNYDIVVSYSSAGLVAGFGVAIALAGEVAWLAITALVLTIGVQGVQLGILRHFWETAMSR